MTGEENDDSLSKDFGPSEKVERKSSNFSAISQTDKNFMVNKVVTSLRTPMKGEASAKSFSMLEHDQYSRRSYKSSNLGNYMADKYRPNAFIFKVEITLAKIALMMLRSMHLILKHEIRAGSRSHFVKELSYHHQSDNETKLFSVCANILTVFNSLFIVKVNG